MREMLAPVSGGLHLAPKSELFGEPGKDKY